MKRLVNAWKRRHMIIINVVDLVTQEMPKKPVYLLDWATKTTYQFEASTILRDSINRLMNHDVMILEPLMPRNPFTNSDLTYGACLSLHKQLRSAGVTHWIWEAYASSNFNLLKLLRNFEIPMKYYCLDLVLKDPTDFNTLEFIMDFMLGEYTHHSIENPPRDIIIFSMITELVMCHVECTNCSYIHHDVDFILYLLIRNEYGYGIWTDDCMLAGICSRSMYCLAL